MTDDSGERAPDEIHGSHFAIVPEWILGESGDVVKLYAILDRYAGKDRKVWPGQDELAKRMECSERQVRRYLTRLREMGALTVAKRRYNGTTIYVLHKDPPDHPRPERPDTTVLTDRTPVSALSGPPSPPNESHSPRAKEPKPPLVGEWLHFETFWAAYPRKTAKAEARKAWVKAVKKTEAFRIVAGANLYATDPYLPEPQFIPHPSTWLNGERWNDGPLPPRASKAKPRTADSAIAEDPSYWEEP